MNTSEQITQPQKRRQRSDAGKPRRRRRRQSSPRKSLDVREDNAKLAYDVIENFMNSFSLSYLDRFKIAAAINNWTLHAMEKEKEKEEKQN